MALMGGGKLGSSKISKTIRLNDAAGVDNFTVLDGDGVPIFKIDSKGVVRMRGGRIQRL